MLLACLIGLLAPHRIVGLDGLSTLEDSRASSQEELPAEEEQNTPSVGYNSRDRRALLCLPRQPLELLSPPTRWVHHY